MAIKSSKLHIPFWGYFCCWVQMLKNEGRKKFFKKISVESLILFKGNHQGLLKHICRFRFSRKREKPGKYPKIGFCLKLNNNA